MVKKARAKAPARRAAAIAKSTQAVISPKVKPGELLTLLDFVRYAVSRFTAAKLAFAHGTTDPVAEAAFIVCETLHLNPEQFETFASARVTAEEGRRILDLIDRRVATRKPAAYLLKRIYMRGLPFYVDERVIVPRSFIGEILDSHFSGDDGSLVDDPAEVASVLDLCTGSGCLAILASQSFPNAQIDAVDLSQDALDVAARNIADHGLGQRVTLYKGDLFGPLGSTRYDLIISNPPYVDAQGMAELPPECRFEPRLAFDGGVDGLDIVRRILNEAGKHLTEEGGLLCEIGRGRALLEHAFPQLPLLWLDTEESDGEVFWIGAEDLHEVGQATPAPAPRRAGRPSGCRRA
jgi:ribosomal protein L3 glutamine methyltransferase